MGGGDRENLRGRAKFIFAYRSDAAARPGSRELRAVKIPASYDAWRPPKHRKNDSGKNRFFWVSEISFSSFFLDFGGAGQFYTSKSASSCNFAPDLQIFNSEQPLELGREGVEGCVNFAKTA